MSATAQNGLLKYIPGLILCMILGWSALQWDYSMHGWQKDFEACQKILKTNADQKSPLPFDEYKAKHAEKYKEQLLFYKQGTLKKEPPKPYILKQDIYESLIAAREIPFKFKFGNKMLEFQLTYVAILLLGGMLIRNTVGVPDLFKQGTVLARPIIKPGIVLLGGYYVWSNLFKVGLVALLLVVIFIFGTVVLVSVLGRKLKQDDGLIGVMAAGTGVCGVSAAVAVAPIVKSKPRDFFYAVGTILLFGTLALFTFPYIGKALGMSEPVFGAWVGTSILNTAQLVAAASWYGHDALLTANIINIVRVGFIPIVVLYCIWFYLVRTAAAEGRSEKMNTWQVIADKFPLFILGFFVMVTLNEFGVFTKDHQYIFGKQFLKIFFAIGFAGVGLNIAFDDLKKAGGKAFFIGLFAASLKAVLSAIVVMFLGTDVFKVK
ncbi:MAG: YeiH family protein [Proteobacteria bacterium]|nr:putative sulfate exporter family transporter [Desulfobacteraceae bacterium]MBU3981590.1 YeiH family protein [Pseudomonadota bacterium]MBU4013790.1 YeiH family protein [Pseudomonadota bacterium]MBU4067731.1 YeiH family protein [Pseudomonadota bacterium]MBU4101070.1 YeiH family protein [Pseudomonadota bacterium]